MTIVEGYEMTGKTTRIRNYVKEGKLCLLNATKSFGFRDPNDEELFINSWELTYPQSWIIGASILKLGALGYNFDDLVLDRGIISSLVYHKMKKNSNVRYLENYIKDIIKYSESNEVTIEIMKHESMESAYEIFKKAKAERKFTDSYDDKDFDDYWVNYITYTALMEDEANRLARCASENGGYIKIVEVKIGSKDNKESE